MSSAAEFIKANRREKEKKRATIAEEKEICAAGQIKQLLKENYLKNKIILEWLCDQVPNGLILFWIISAMIGSKRKSKRK